jgi:hypothetical protein
VYPKEKKKHQNPNSHSNKKKLPKMTNVSERQKASIKGMVQRKGMGQKISSVRTRTEKKGEAKAFPSQNPNQKFQERIDNNRV